MARKSKTSEEEKQQPKKFYFSFKPRVQYKKEAFQTHPWFSGQVPDKEHLKFVLQDKNSGEIINWLRLKYKPTNKESFLNVLKPALFVHQDHLDYFYSLQLLLLLDDGKTTASFPTDFHCEFEIEKDTEEEKIILCFSYNEDEKQDLICKFVF